MTTAPEMEVTMEEKKSVFRQKSLERISTPEQLTEYLRVTTPGIWLLLAGVIILLAGLVSWACVGQLETYEKATAVVSEGKITLMMYDARPGTVAKGMPVIVEGTRTSITVVTKDDYGRETAYCNTDLPDGTYDADVIVESISPISFLLN